MAQSLNIEIADSVVEVFPQVEVLALRVSISDQTRLAPTVSALEVDILSIGQDLAEVEPITGLPEISVWREAYAKLGVKPSRYPSSIEALIRRTRKGQMTEIGIPVVDLYNRVSVIHRVPMGAYDVSRLGDGPLVLRQADPEHDRFAPLGGDPAGFPLNPDLVVYAQGSDILCWGFNTRDSALSAVEQGSTDIVFFSETPVSNGVAAASEALSHLSQSIAEVGGRAGPVMAFSAAAPRGTILPVV